MKTMKVAWIGLVVILMLSPRTAPAASPWEEYDKLISKQQTISALGPELFGDTVDLSTGALSFSNKDVSLPGNNALPVEVSRTFTVRGQQYRANDGAFGDWDIDIPHVSGIFATTWHDNRCTSPMPPTVSPPPYGDPVQGEFYWKGNTATMPFGGEMLKIAATTSRPSTGGPYYWITSGRTVFSCLASIDNGSGQGFLAIAPDGVKYWFNHMAQVAEDPFEMPVLTSDGSTRVTPVTRKLNALYATRMEDRFGNWVTYSYSNNYNQPVHVTGIASNDGRGIAFGYNASGKIASVTAAGKTWSYTYSGSSLSAVTLPDASHWTFALSALNTMYMDYMADESPTWRTCFRPGTLRTTPATGTMTHPSGATGTFTVSPILSGRTNVPAVCRNWYPRGYPLPNANIQNDDIAIVPFRWHTLALTSKTIQGVGLASQTWSYAYQAASSYFYPDGGTTPTCSTTTCLDPTCLSDSCAGTMTATVTGPDGAWKRYTFGNSYRYNEGKQLKLEEGVGATVMRSITLGYDMAQLGRAYPVRIGVSPQPYDNGFVSEYPRPEVSKAILQDGATFTREVNWGCGSPMSYCFDSVLRPLQGKKFSTISGNPVKNEVVEYQDDPVLWVLGQVKRTAINGIEASKTDYGWKSLPWKNYAFGKLTQTLAYETAVSGQVGTLKTVADGNGHVTGLAGWKRGIPQTVTYPATTDQPTAVTQKATVDDNGWITSVTDENGYKTCYGYDAMGRVNKITYPSETQAGVCDASAWTPTTITFNGGNPAAYGMPAGHWRQTTQTGRGRKIIIYDALWRPVVEQTVDLDRISASLSEVIRRYDASGRPEFQSYPMNTGGAAVYTDASLKGTHTTYDALGRVIRVEQNSELDVTLGKPLTTQIEYLTGFQTRATNPNGAKTLTALYQAFDEPTYDFPRGISHPAGAFTEIYRDAFGKPTAIKRRNSDSSVSITRRFVYNLAQELCKQIEPETGSTVMHYDGAGNMDWRAAGLNLASPTSCEDTDASIPARKVSRGYDARNRLKTLSFPDSEGNQTWTYTPDSLPASVATTMLSDPHIVTNLHAYNRRRLLATETQQITSWGTYTLTRQYDANGHLARLVYPAGYLGSVVDYAPNALGQPTKAGTFASAVTYYPNGAIKSFTYGNGIKHTLTQNLRGLPDTSCDFVTSCDASAVLNDGYDYDPNGNVAAISDGRTGHRGDRDMTYDALDRLTQAVSPMFGTATYAYDPLDNLTHVKLTAGNQIRDHYYCYDATWRLTNVKTGSCTGNTVMGLGYDVQGNLANRSGVVYKFDYGNRLREVVGREDHYWYDGYGRRAGSNRLVNGSSVRRSIYSQDGQLLFVQDQGEGKRKEYIYLGGSLLAERSLPNTGAATPVTVRYQHTDALGSPVAITNESKGVVEKTEYEPYGWAANRIVRNGPGYAGHHEDAATGMVYMQQRYYDPLLGRFLSVDPVTVNTTTAANFCRYCYANNNPYRFTDPDGRDAADRAYGAAVGYMLRNDPERMRIWAGGEAAARTEGSAAEQGAAMGEAAGAFVDNGDFSGPAVAVAVVKAMVAAITRGKTGHYTNTHQSGKKYHGKGNEARMNKSAADKAKANNDPVVSKQHTPTENAREAFKGEARAIEADGGPGKGNYNQINSPGKKYLEEDRIKK